MSEDQREYTIRLKMEGGKVVSADLGHLGQTGQDAFKKINASASLTDLAFNNLKRSIVSNLLPYFGAGALLSGIKSVTSALGEINDTAEITGNTIEKLQEFRYAAAAIGKDGALMDSSLTEFNQRLGAAQNGMGKLLPILRSYNIELKDSAGNNRKAGDVLRDYADAIANASTQQERAFLMDKAGLNENLIKAFENGSKGLDTFAAKAHEAGYVIDEELVKKADELEDSWSLAWDVMVKKTEASVMEIIDIIDKMKDVHVSVPTVLPGGYMVGEENGSATTANKANKGNAEYDRLAAEDAAADTAAGTKHTFDPNAEDKAKEAERRADAIKKQLEDLAFRNKLMQTSNEEQSVYNELQKNNVDLTSDAGQKIRALVLEHERLNRVQKLSADIAKEIGSSLEKAFIDGKGSLADFGKELERLAFRIAIEEPLVKSLTSVFSGSTAFSSMFSSLGNMLPSFDVGTPYVPHDMVANIHQGERILTAKENAAYMAGNASGGDVYVQITNQTPAQVQVKQSASGNRREIEVMIQEVVAGGINSTGPINTALRKFGKTPKTSG